MPKSGGGLFMVRKRIWIFILAAMFLLAVLLICLFIFFGKGEGVYKGADFVMKSIRDAFLHIPGGIYE